MVLDTLYWEITARCPLACKHCYQGDRLRESDNILSLEESLQRVDNFSKNNIKVILLTGGEPLLNPYIFDIIKRSRSRNIDTAILTSGCTITKKVARKIAIASPNTVQISIDGIGNIYDNIRGKGIFKKVENAIDNLKEYGVSHYMKMTINKLNFYDVDNVMEYCHNRKLKVNFCNAISIGYTKKEEIMINPQQYFNIFIKLYEKKYKEGKNITLPDFAIEEYMNKQSVKSMCSAGRRMAVLTSDDTFLPCPFIAGIELKKSDGILVYSHDVIKMSDNDKLFNVLRKHNANSYSCPLRKLQNKGRDPYSVEAFIEYTGGKYGPLRR